jgi:hypothetical protein
MATLRLKPRRQGMHGGGTVLLLEANDLYSTVGSKYFREYQIYSNGVYSRKDFCFGQELRELSTCNKLRSIPELPAVDTLCPCWRAFRAWLWIWPAG